MKSSEKVGFTLMGLLCLVGLLLRNTVGLGLIMVLSPIVLLVVMWFSDREDYKKGSPLYREIWRDGLTK